VSIRITCAVVELAISACSVGPDFGIGVASRSMKWLFNAHMLSGAVLGWLIVSSALHLLDTARHEGSGVVLYGDGERSPERLEPCKGY
jgi:hypothetical protein